MERFLVFLAGAGIGTMAGRWLNREPAYPALWRPAAPDPDHRTVRVVDVMVRTQSLLREIRALVVHADVPDPLLEEKIKAKVARIVARPDAVQVRVEAGNVSLAGTARAAEIRALADWIASLRGVKAVANRMEALTPPFTSWDDAEPGSRPAQGKPGSYPASVSIFLAAAGMAISVIGYRIRRGEGVALLAAGAVLLGSGAAGLFRPRKAGQGVVSHMSESSSWRPGMKGFRSAAAP